EPVRASYACPADGQSRRHGQGDHRARGPAGLWPARRRRRRRVLGIPVQPGHREGRAPRRHGVRGAGREMLRRPDELDVPARRGGRLRRGAVRPERVQLQEPECQAHLRLRIVVLRLICASSGVEREGRAGASLFVLRATGPSSVGFTCVNLHSLRNPYGDSMKIIAAAAFALVLAAFGARAQTATGTGTSDTRSTATPNSQSTEDKGSAVLPADQNSSALPGNSSNSSSSNSSLPSNNPASNATPPADTGSKTEQPQKGSSSNDTSAAPDTSSSAVPSRGAAST